MKVLKKADQKNVTLNTNYYTESQIDEMVKNLEVCKFDFDKPITYRIFLSEVKELKVVLDDYRFYTTVAVGKNGKLYYINL